MWLHFYSMEDGAWIAVAVLRRGGCLVPSPFQRQLLARWQWSRAMSPQGFANQKLVCKMLSFTDGGSQKQAKAAKLLLLGAFILRSLLPS